MAALLTCTLGLSEQAFSVVKKGCGGTPTGLVHKKNRGHFDLIKLMPHAGGVLTELQSDFELQWQVIPHPQGENPFIPSASVCCCDEVKFAQLTRVEGATSISFNWKVDKKVPYPHLLQVGKPCKQPFPTAASMDDNPGLSRIKLTNAAVRSYKHFFETCAYCDKGNEGINVDSSGRIIGITVYNCLTWRHEFENKGGVTPNWWVKRKFHGKAGEEDWYSPNGGPRIIFAVSGDKLGIVGLEPSEYFRTRIIGALYDVNLE
jgi:hypothetical protein